MIRDLAVASLRQDARMIAMGGRTLGWRVRFLARKHRALLALTLGNTELALEGGPVHLSSLSELGTTQSNIVDFYDTVVRAGLLADAPLVLDVGANVGQFARSVKLFYPAATVVSYEPDPATFARLVENTGSLSGLSAVNLAIGPARGTAKFYRHYFSVMSSLKPPADPRAVRDTLTVDTQRLDDVVDPAWCPDLVKIDVEGYESEVLAGGWGTVRRSRYLLLELSLGRREGSGNLQLLRQVQEALPAASIVRFGRALGEVARPVCQDVLIAVRGAEPV